MRTIQSLYTTLLPAPPAACIAIPSYSCPPDQDKTPAIAEATPGREASHPGSTKDGTTTTAVVVGSDDDDSDCAERNGGGVPENGGSGAAPRWLLVTGTYTLNKDTQQRSGSLLLHEATYDAVTKLTLHQTVPLSPDHGSILDIRHLPTSKSSAYPHGSSFAVATSTGYLIIYTLSISEDTNKSPTLTHLFTHNITGDSSTDTLLLSLAICPPNPLLFSITTNKSTILLLSLSEDYSVITHLSEIDQAHTGLETWTSCFSPSGTELYSGGDDASFAIWDLSELSSSLSLNGGDLDEGREEVAIPLILRNKRVHGAGVTAILPITVEGDEYVLTGSYDQSLRLYHHSTRRFLGDGIDLGGGVWRLELLPAIPSTSSLNPTSSSATKRSRILVLASCMHAGCRIVQVEFDLSEGGEVQVQLTALGGMEEHESMNYASATVGDPDGEGGVTVVSTSFYDLRMVVWRAELDRD